MTYAHLHLAAFELDFHKTDSDWDAYAELAACCSFGWDLVHILISHFESQQNLQDYSLVSSRVANYVLDSSQFGTKLAYLSFVYGKNCYCWSEVVGSEHCDFDEFLPKFLLSDLVATILRYLCFPKRVSVVSDHSSVLLEPFAAEYYYFRSTPWPCCSLVRKMWSLASEY